MIKIGTAQSTPGAIQTGHFEAFTHPTGQSEFLPVVIAQGRAEGPCMWLTAGIHGNEHAGPALIYELINQKLVDHLQGTIVALPLLSPAGVRTMKRIPYHDQTDPNRLWPNHSEEVDETGDKPPPSVLEKTYASLFEQIVETADYLIDYHNYSIGSISFALRDPVFYSAGEEAEANHARATKLADQQAQLLAAYGHTIVREFAAETYLKAKLHRSTSAAAMLLAGIPAFTAELGVGPVPDWNIVRAGAAGTRNVLRWAGMLRNSPEPIHGIPIINPGYPVRRMRTPRVPTGCAVLFRVAAGDIVEKGDILAELRDGWGRPVDPPTIYAEHDGFVIGRAHGIFFNSGEAIMSMAIRDDSMLVLPYPQK